MPGIEKYCRICNEEIMQDGCTNYHGKKWCECVENLRAKRFGRDSEEVSK